MAKDQPAYALTDTAPAHVLSVQHRASSTLISVHCALGVQVAVAWDEVEVAAHANLTLFPSGKQSGV